MDTTCIAKFSKNGKKGFFGRGALRRSKKLKKKCSLSSDDSAVTAPAALWHKEIDAFTS